MRWLGPNQNRPVTHVFLVPDVGLGRLVTLHDRLYAGQLTVYLRLDLPFVPHVTIAALADGAAAFQLARTLNEEGISMHGALTRLTVAQYADGLVTNRVDVALDG